MAMDAFQHHPLVVSWEKDSNKCLTILKRSGNGMARGDIAKRGPGPGRPKGSKDKLPTELRARMMAIADQLEAKGKGLDVEAEKDPRWFYETFIKPLLPKDIKAELGGKLEFFVRVDRDPGT